MVVGRTAPAGSGRLATADKAQEDRCASVQLDDGRSLSPDFSLRDSDTQPVSH